MELCFVIKRHFEIANWDDFLAYKKCLETAKYTCVGKIRFSEILEAINVTTRLRILLIFFKTY
jgi:hypothetical protein